MRRPLDKKTKHIFRLESRRPYAGAPAEACQMVEVSVGLAQADELRWRLGLRSCTECEGGGRAPWDHTTYCLFCAGWGLLDDAGRALVSHLKE